ncbi:alanine racemase [bacterium]|nr:alanine racemase [candidate division CSSED10-310 bacterium]
MNSENKIQSDLDLKTELASILEEIPSCTAPDFFAESLRRINLRCFQESIRCYGTPQYILDTDALIERCRLFVRTIRRRLPDSEFFYAFKCNDLPFIANTVCHHGFHADVAGLFELQLALQIGCKRIVFNSPGKTDDELTLAVTHSQRVIIIIDNFDEIDRLKTLCTTMLPETPVTVGLRLAVGRRTDDAWHKFGFELDDVPEAIARISESPSLVWRGLHFHSSWNKTPLKYYQTLQTVGRFMERHLPQRIRLGMEFVDIGGGFYPENQAVIHHCEDKGILADMMARRHGGRKHINRMLDHDPHAFLVTEVDPLETFAETIAEAMDTHIRPLAPNAAVFMEPGRFIVAHSTAVLLRVLAVKQDSVIVDGGINMMGDYKFSEYAFAPVINLRRPSAALHSCTVYGPLCDPSDLWGYSHYGDPLQRGDAVAVLHQGAYTYSTAWRFIKAIPAYIAFSGDTVSMIKPAETFEDRYGLRFRD